MNYLAHIFLSGDDSRMQFGNFIGDAVKGNAYNGYPQAVMDGILLHRAIDAFTDNHTAVKETVQPLKPHFGRYSGIILDMYFDYLLASRFSEFSEYPLKKYSRRFYFTIIRNYRILPGSMKKFMWHFIGTNRLNKYATKKGIKRSLEIMNNVHGLGLHLDTAMRYLVENEEKLWTVFQLFFSELQDFCNGYINAGNRAEYLKSVNNE